MTFFERYPLPLTELLVAPVVFRENMSLLRDLPPASARGMRDLAEFGGYRYGAIRTALFRLRVSGQLEASRDAQGVTRYRMGPLFRSVSSAVQAAMDGAHPGFSDAVEVVDVATPVTTERYTGSHEGRFMTWLSSSGGRAVRNIPKTIPGLKDFYLAGMWVLSPGGLPSAVKSARDVIQVICKRDRVRFRTSRP